MSDAERRLNDLERKLKDTERKLKDAERKLETRTKIDKESTKKKVVCPLCLVSFSQPRNLLSHFRKKNDEIHRGLHRRKKDNKRFLDCYQEALGYMIPARLVPNITSMCYKVDFIVENRGKDTDPASTRSFMDMNAAHSSEFTLVALFFVAICASGGQEHHAGNPDTEVQLVSHSQASHMDIELPQEPLHTGKYMILSQILRTSLKTDSCRRLTLAKIQGKSDISSPFTLDTSHIFNHLKILHYTHAEEQLSFLIPQIESWLLGSLPLPNNNEIAPDDPDIILPWVEDIDTPLKPLRNRVYDGVML